MFFKQTVLERMFKAAYKHAGLIIGHHADEMEGYFIASGWWIMWFTVAQMPKEVKAAIIKLCGDLPTDGNVFRAMADMGNQYEIEQNEMYNLPEIFEKCVCKFGVSNLIQLRGNKKIRFIQEENTNHIMAVSEMAIELIDLTAIDCDSGECSPNGPLGLSPMTRYVCWGNNVCWFMVMTKQAEEEEEEFWTLLENMDII